VLSSCQDLLHQVFNIIVDASDISNELLVVRRLHALCPHEVMLNIREVPILIPEQGQQKNKKG
jgi:hypothetical protein